MPKHKTFWKDRVMVGKRQKIDDISSRNAGIPTIFNSEKELGRFRDMIYINNSFGMPNFHYQSYEQKEELEIKDILNYFQQNSTILVKVSEKEVEKATVIHVIGKNGSPVNWTNFKDSNPSDIEFILVKMRGEEKAKTIHISNTRRIL